MNAITAITVGITVIGLGSIVFTWLSKIGTKTGQQIISGSRDSIMETIFQIIEKSSDETLWSIAGELDFRFYQKIYPKLKERLDEHGMKIEFVAGPRIVISDENYRRYVQDGKKVGEYWKAHPLVQLAYDYAASGKVKLYIKTKEDGREQRHCFGTTKNGVPFVTERGHPELLPSPVIIERGTRVGYQCLRERFEEVIASKLAILWNPLGPRGEEQIDFISFTRMRKESGWIA